MYLPAKTGAFISETSNREFPHYILKTPTGSGKRTIDNQFAKIKNQIIHNPGGMILDCTYLSNSNFEVIESVSKRMILSCFVGDVIVVRNAHIVDILHNNKR